MSISMYRCSPFSLFRNLSWLLFLVGCACWLLVTPGSGFENMEQILERTVCVENLPSGYDASQLRVTLAIAGQVERVLEIDDRAVFVIYSGVSQAEGSVSRLNKETFGGNEIKVRLVEGSEQELITRLMSEQNASGSMSDNTDNKTDQVLHQVQGMSLGEKQNLLISLQNELFTQHATSPPQNANIATSLPPPAFPQMPIPDHYHSASSHSQPLRLSQFSGDKEHKNEVSFQQWKFEVLALQRDPTVDQTQLMHAIRRSLRGKAGELMVNMGQVYSIPDLLIKLDGMFGNILPWEVLLERFYSARQHKGESIISWACRLEEMIGQIQECDSTFTADTRNGMLRTKFWSGLHSDNIRNALRHRYDAATGYDLLVRAARCIELEQTKPGGQVQQVSVDTKTDQVNQKLDTLFRQFKDLKQQVSNMQGSKRSNQNTSAGNESSDQSRQFRGRCFKCKKFGHRIRDCHLNSAKPAPKADE